MSDAVRRFAVTTVLTAALAVPAVSDGPLVIRCVDYEKPIVMLPSGERVGWYKPGEPLDISISFLQKVGWFRGNTMRIDEEKPAALTVAPDAYTLTRTEDFRGTVQTEWMVLDRVDGTVRVFARLKGMPASVLLRGGHCSKLEARF